MAGKSIGNVNLTLRGDASKLGGDLKKGMASAKSVLAKGATVAAAATAVAAAAVLATTAAVYKLTKAGMESVRALGALSDQLQVDTVKLQGYQLAMERAGGSSEGMNKALSKLNENIGKAVRDGGTMARSFESLGLEMEDIASLPTDEAFEKVGMAISQLSSASEKSAAAIGIFGKNGQEMLTVFKDGASGLEAAAKDIDELGLGLSRIDVAKVEIANDTLGTLKKVFASIGQYFAIEFSPIIDDLTQRVLGAVKEMGGFSEVIKKCVKFGVKGFAYLQTAINGIKLAFSALKMAAAAYLQFQAEIFYKLTKILDRFKQNFVDGINEIIKASNRLIRTKFELISVEDTNQWLDDFVEKARTRTKEGVEEVAAGIMEAISTPWPTDVVDEWYSEVTEKMDAAAEEVARKSTEINDRSIDFDAMYSGEQQAALDSLMKSLMAQEESIKASYDERKNIILEATQLTEDERLKLLQRSESKYKDQMGAMDKARWNAALASYDDFQDNMLTLSKTGNKTLSGVFKAAAIANTTIKTYEAAQSAYASQASIPIYGPALGAAAAAAAIAAGMANVAAIKSQQSFEGGGFTGYGSRSGGVDGRGGFQAILHPNEQVIDLTKSSVSGGSSTIVVNNYGSAEVETREREEGGRRIVEVLVDRIKNKELPAAIQRGGNALSSALEGTYGLKRGYA